jgi:hypothetical protein
VISHVASVNNKHLILDMTGPFSTFEQNHPELVAVDTKGQISSNVMDFCKSTFPIFRTPFIMLL